MRWRLVEFKKEIMGTVNNGDSYGKFRGHHTQRSEVSSRGAKPCIAPAPQDGTQLNSAVLFCVFNRKIAGVKIISVKRQVFQAKNVLPLIGNN